MARPREYFEERKVTAIRFPMRVRDQLKAVADHRSTSVNRLVNAAVLHFLEGLPGERIHSIADHPDRRLHPTQFDTNG